MVEEGCLSCKKSVEYLHGGLKESTEAVSAQIKSWFCLTKILWIMYGYLIFMALKRLRLCQTELQTLVNANKLFMKGREWCQLDWSEEE